MFLLQMLQHFLPASGASFLNSTPTSSFKMLSSSPKASSDVVKFSSSLNS